MFRNFFTTRNTAQDYHIHKFGSNSEVSNSSHETIWSKGGLYPWSSLDDAETIYVKSTSSSDTGSIVVEGLDENWNRITQTKTMTGTTAVTLDSTMRRVFRMEYSDTTNNAGTITARVTSGSGTIVAQVEAGDNQTLMCVYTVPVGYVGHLLQYSFSCEKGSDAQIDMVTREPGSVFKIKSEMESFETPFTQAFPVPLVIQPKTDIDFRALAPASGGKKVYLNFDLVMQKI